MKIASKGRTKSIVILVIGLILGGGFGCFAIMKKANTVSSTLTQLTNNGIFDFLRFYS